MRLALAQITCDPGQVDHNVHRIVDLIATAAGQGCDAIVFPEMSDTAYHMPTILTTASSWDGAVFHTIANAAARMRIVVFVGLSERDGANIFNSVAVIGTNGQLIAKYRKTHLIKVDPVFEHQFITPGDSATICTVGGFRIGLMICYDIRFPELARRLTLDGADILIVPAAFPAARINHWEILARARAIENQVYVAAVNRVGTDSGLTFGGNSRLFDPSGVPLAVGNEHDEGLLIGEIQTSRLMEVRDGLRVLQDRRPELYR